jgi:hypothetical protein
MTLGSPSMFLNNSMANGRSTSKFLRTRAYEATGDAEFIRFCTGYRYFRRAYTLYFIAGMLLLWLPSIIIGHH